MSLILVGMSWAAIFLGLSLLALPHLLPDLPDTVNVPPSRLAILVLDRQGERIGTRGLNHADPAALEDLPPHLPQAVLAVEDRRFYWHFGVDLIGLGRALWVNWQEGSVVQGGSTITQQLAKNLFLTPERTLRRKLDEVVYALWLEQKLTKDEILELYLNRVYLGAGTYGVEAASQRYFGKSASEVTLVEAAMLAGLLKAPSRYTPTASFQRASDRTGLVLSSMLEAGYISHAELQSAYAMPARIRPAAATPGSDYILDWLENQVPDYVGPDVKSVTVHTTIDLRLQREAEHSIKRVLDRSGDQLNATEAALVSLSPNGAVLALVGGRSYRESAYNRAITANRQPGSAFKPFTYVAAINAGWAPWNVVVDEPLQIGDWAPTNYTQEYLGAVTIETALAKSVNTVAIRLANEVGRKKVIESARDFGILSPLAPHPSLPLGTQEVNLYELTVAYAPFANGGLKVYPHIVSHIQTKSGETIYGRQSPPEERIARPFTIGAMNKMMRRTVETGTGRRASLEGHIAAGKTGTSAGYRDAWFVGYTNQVVTGVWVGNDNFEPMKQVTGGSLPADIWRGLMASAVESKPDTAFGSHLPFEDLATPPAFLPAGAAYAGNEVEILPPPDDVSSNPLPSFFDRIAAVLRRHSSAD